MTEFGSLNHSPGKRVLNNLKTIRRYPGLVAFYVIRSGNGAGLFLQPRSPHGATLNNPLTLVYNETDNALLLVRKQKLSYWQKNHDSYTIQASVWSNCRIESDRIQSIFFHESECSITCYSVILTDGAFVCHSRNLRANGFTCFKPFPATNSDITAVSQAKYYMRKYTWRSYPRMFVKCLRGILIFTASSIIVADI